MKQNHNRTSGDDQEFIRGVRNGLFYTIPHIERCIGSHYVMITGNLGAGKSTFIRYLMNAPLQLQSSGINPLTGRERIHLTHPTDETTQVPVIRNKTTAIYPYPTTYSFREPYVFSHIEDSFYCSRSKVTVNNLANDMIINSVKHIKGIVVVADAKDLGCRAIIFTETLSKLWSIFNAEAANLDTSWQASVRLVVSKIPIKATATDVSKYLKELLVTVEENEQKKPGSCPYLPLLKAFAEHPERIFCFPAAAAKTRDCAKQWLASLDLMPGIDKSLIAKQASLRDHSHLALAVGSECAEFNKRFTPFDLARKKLTSLQASHSAKEKELATAKAEKEDIKKKKAVDRMNTQLKVLSRKIGDARITLATHRKSLVNRVFSYRGILQLNLCLDKLSIEMGPTACQAIKSLQTDPDMQNILAGLHDTSHEPARASTHGAFSAGVGGAKPKAKAGAKAKPSTALTP